MLKAMIIFKYFGHLDGKRGALIVCTVAVLKG